MDPQSQQGVKKNAQLQMILEHQKEAYNESLKEHRKIFILTVAILVVILFGLSYLFFHSTKQYREEIINIKKQYNEEKQNIIDTAFYIKDSLIGSYYVDNKKKYEDFVLLGGKSILELYEKEKIPKQSRMDQKQIKEYLDITYKGSNLVGIDPYLLLAIDYVESNFRINAISPAGARGICQFMPITAKLIANSETHYSILQVDSYSIKKLFDPIYSKKLQIRYMKYLLDMFNGRVEWALLAYNWGPTIVLKRWWKNGEITFNQLPEEQQQYASKVLAAYHYVKDNGMKK